MKNLTLHTAQVQSRFDQYAKRNAQRTFVAAIATDDGTKLVRDCRLDEVFCPETASEDVPEFSTLFYAARIASEAQKKLAEPLALTVVVRDARLQEPAFREELVKTFPNVEIVIVARAENRAVDVIFDTRNCDFNLFTAVAVALRHVVE